MKWLIGSLHVLSGLGLRFLPQEAHIVAFIQSPLYRVAEKNDCGSIDE